MKKIDFLIILIVFLVGLIIGVNTQNKCDRYQIVKTDLNIILLDKKTGLTWRNVWIDDKERIMNYWDEMLMTGDKNMSVPIGKQKSKNNAFDK